MATGRVPTTANSPLTAKGDLFGYSTTQARVPVGSDGETLVADSSASTGLRWQGNFAAGKNRIINGDFNIWQRGTTFSGGNSYTADRWFADGATTISRQAGTDQFTYCLRIANSTGNPAIRQAIELPAQGNPGIFRTGTTWTFSFWARTSTSIAAPFALYIAFSDAVGDSNPSVVFSSFNIGASSTSWTRYTATFTISATPNATNRSLSVVPYLANGVSYSGNVDITGVQLEAGSVATAFQTATGTLAGELAACQRYYFRSTPANSFGWLGYGIAQNTTATSIGVVLPSVMRVTPTSVDFSTLALVDGVTATAVTSCTLDSSVSSTAVAVVTASVASGLTQYRSYMLRQNSNSAGHIGFSAEL